MSAQYNRTLREVVSRFGGTEQPIGVGDPV